MKKLLLFSLVIIFLMTGCKKNPMEPLGPTDIRVLNISDVTMTNVMVNTYDSTFNFGTINPGDTTIYHRFDRAYTKANISAVINGLTYKTDTVFYTYMHYMGQVKATYQVYIKNEAQRQLEMIMNGYDAPLK